MRDAGCPSPRAAPRTCCAVCALLLLYCGLGGLLFYSLEGGAAGAGGAELRAGTVARLWALTEDLNILYKDNWTALAARELLAFQRDLAAQLRAGDSEEQRWTLPGSCLYALTLITTIGHGNVTPRTAAGKLAAVGYACVGIPLVMLYLSAVGDSLAAGLRALYWRARPAPPGSPPAATPFQAALELTWRRAPPARPPSGGPALLGVALTALYVVLGAFVFRHTERWSLAEGCFFSFSALATVGLGALRPGGGAARGAVCGGYLLVGIAAVAMCFSLCRAAAAG